MSLLLWELSQERRTREAKAESSVATSKAQEVQLQLSAVQRQVDRLSLACQALWELLLENTDIDEKGLRERIQQVDERGGRANGKVAHKPVECAQCGRTGNTRRGSCVYCGAKLESH